jgi:hypothetical protein
MLAVTADFSQTYIVGIKGYSNIILSMLAHR